MTCNDAHAAPVRGPQGRPDPDRGAVSPAPRLAFALTRTVASACLIALSCAPARAALGGDAASIEQDRARLGAQRVVASTYGAQAQAQAQAPLQAPAPIAAAAPFQEHRLTLADGSTVREFATPGGRVFAVAWSTRLKPRLEPLLGDQSARYATATREALRVPGARHGLSIDEGDLVVHATSRLNSHVGIAYLRSLVPAGLSVDALR